MTSDWPFTLEDSLPGGGRSPDQGRSVASDMREIFGHLRLDRASAESWNALIPEKIGQIPSDPQLENRHRLPIRTIIGAALCLTVLVLAVLVGHYVADPITGPTNLVLAPVPAPKNANTACSNGGIAGERCPPTDRLGYQAPKAVPTEKNSVETPALKARPEMLAQAKNKAAKRALQMCVGTAYQELPVCPPRAVLDADRELADAYASAIHNNVPVAVLAPYVEHWSDLQAHVNNDPVAAIAAYQTMTVELKAHIAAAENR